MHLKIQCFQFAVKNTQAIFASKVFNAFLSETIKGGERDLVMQFLTALGLSSDDARDVVSPRDIFDL